MSPHLIVYSLKAAVKDKLLLGYILLVIVTFSLSMFMGSSAITEKNQFALVFLSGSLRFLTSLTLALFCVFFIRRSFDAKDIEFLLSRPISRTSLVLSFSAGMSVLAVMLSAISSAFVFAISPDIGYAQILWAFSLLCEAVIVVNVAIFFSLVIRSSVNALLALMAFYVFARLSGEILGILDADSAGWASIAAINIVIQAITVIVPRLDIIAQTSWLIYGVDGESVGFLYVLSQSVIFIGLVLSAAVFDLAKKKF